MHPTILGVQEDRMEERRTRKTNLLSQSHSHYDIHSLLANYQRLLGSPIQRIAILHFTSDLVVYNCSYLFVSSFYSNNEMTKTASTITNPSTIPTTNRQLLFKSRTGSTTSVFTVRFFLWWMIILVQQQQQPQLLFCHRKCSGVCHAFGVIVQSSSRKPPPLRSTSWILNALLLSERQMQFWEDVEDGLDDIAAFYAKQQQQPREQQQLKEQQPQEQQSSQEPKNIDRIRTFAKR